MGDRAGLRVYPQRRPVATRRLAFRLELDFAPFGRQPERVYNGSYRVRPALEDWRTLERRRLWPRRRLAHDGGCGGALLLSAEGAYPTPGRVPLAGGAMITKFSAACRLLPAALLLAPGFGLLNSARAADKKLTE